MSITSKVRAHINTLPAGQPFTTGSLSLLGPRATVERTLSRLANSEDIVRVSRGVYMRPEISKYGNVPPSTFKVALAKAHGSTIQMHGADALRRFGLSTQHPVQAIYYTTGASRRFMVSGEEVVMKHISPRKIICPGTDVGLAVLALWYLGKKKTTKKALSQIKKHLSESEYQVLLANTDKMPGWMSDALYHFEGQGSKHA